MKYSITLQDKAGNTLQRYEAKNVKDVAEILAFSKRWQVGLYVVHIVSHHSTAGDQYKSYYADTVAFMRLCNPESNY